MTRAISGSSSTTRMFFIFATGPAPRTRRGRTPTPCTPLIAAVTLPPLDRGSSRAVGIGVLVLLGIWRRGRCYRRTGCTGRLSRASHRGPVFRRGWGWRRCCREAALPGAITGARSIGWGRRRRVLWWVLDPRGLLMRLSVPLLEKCAGSAEDGVSFLARY